ncbi:MAG: phytanoyl-CoA dioxygenase family protein [Burkholderiales bacterium]
MTTAFSPAELAAFERDGYVVARGLTATADCGALRAIAQRDLTLAVPPLEYEADVKYPGAPVSRDAPGGHTARRLLQATTRDPAFARWATSAPMAARLQQLLGPRVELSQVHHNCVMTKNPSHSSVTHWHRDIRYWAFTREELVSVWLALGRERPENGCLLVLPGSHRMDFRDDRLDAAKFLRPDLPENQPLLKTQVAVELDAGDVLFFHCRLLHAAGDNRTAETKFSAVFTYHAADNPPLPGTRSAALPDLPL